MGYFHVSSMVEKLLFTSGVHQTNFNSNYKVSIVARKVITKNNCFRNINAVKGSVQS